MWYSNGKSSGWKDGKTKLDIFSTHVVSCIFGCRRQPSLESKLALWYLKVSGMKLEQYQVHQCGEVFLYERCFSRLDKKLHLLFWRDLDISFYRFAIIDVSVCRKHLLFLLRLQSRKWWCCAVISGRMYATPKSQFGTLACCPSGWVHNFVNERHGLCDKAWDSWKNRTLVNFKSLFPHAFGECVRFFLALFWCCACNSIGHHLIESQNFVNRQIKALYWLFSSSIVLRFVFGHLAWYCSEAVCRRRRFGGGEMMLR